MKEQIKLEDFLNLAIKPFKMDNDYFKPEIGFSYVCPECKKSYSANDKFCSKDGAIIKEETYNYLSDDTRHNIIAFLYDFSSTKTPKSFPFEYIDSIEKRGDGDGYYNNFIFKRKSDDKFFYYTSYDGRIEEKYLEETNKIGTVKWDFEKLFD